MHFNPKISAIKGIIIDVEKMMQDDSVPSERVQSLCQTALGSINGISELEKPNGNKTCSKTRVRK